MKRTPGWPPDEDRVAFHATEVDREAQELVAQGIEEQLPLGETGQHRV